MASTVKLYHPDDPDAEIEVEQERASLFKASGWGEDKPKADKKASTTK